MARREGRVTRLERLEHHHKVGLLPLHEDWVGAFSAGEDSPETAELEQRMEDIGTHRPDLWRQYQRQVEELA